MKSFVTSFILAAICAHRLFAQVNDIKFDRLSVERGLSQNSVYVVYQDHKGFMWFGTADGLNRYDGYSFTVFKHRQFDSTSLSNSAIRSVFEDSKGNLWVGTDGGLNLFNRGTEKFLHCNLLNDDSTNAIIGGIGRIYEDNAGTLFIGSNSLLECDVSSSPNVLSPRFRRYVNGDTSGKSSALGEVNDIFEDKDKRLWLATSNGLWTIDREKKKFFPYLLFKQNQALLKLSINSIFEHEPNVLWLGSNTLGQAMLELHIPSHFPRPINGVTVQMRSPVSAIRRDVKGDVWIGTYGDGIFRIVRETGEITHFLHNAGNNGSLSFDLIKKMFVDRSGILWIGTDGGGVSFVDPNRKPFTHYAHNPFGEKSLSGNFLKAIYEDRRGRLWIGTVSHGLNFFDRTKNLWKRYMHTPYRRTGILSNNIFDIVEDEEGNLWIAEGAGLDKFNPETEAFTHFVVPHQSALFDDVHALAFDGRKNLWIASSLGVYLKQHGKNQITPIPKLSYYLWTLYYSKRSGIMWGGSYGSGLVKIDPRTFSVVHYPPNASSLNALSNGSVRSIWEDSSGVLWLGTEEGLNRFDPKTETFTRFTERDGLGNDFIYGILGDEHGNLWLSTNGGLSRFSPNNPHGESAANWRQGKQFWNFDVSDGLQANEFNTGAYCKGKNGEMFFGGVNGFTSFFPDSIHPNRYIPPVVITGMKTTKGTIFREGNLTEKDTVMLQYDENDFTLSYVTLNYTQPEKNRYAYKLEGFDKRWINAGNERQVRFTNLDPGEYVFHVKASNNDGVWNETGASLRIIIVPPFWATWWFRLLAAIVILSAVGGAARYVTLRRVERKIQELQHQRALEYERARISQDMHDEVGSSLTQIAILSELVKRDLQFEGEAEKQIEKISETARGVVDNMSQIIWAIDPKNDKLENLIAYVHAYLAEYFDVAGITTRFLLSETMPMLKLTAKFRRNVFLTVKEAANNIVKHAGATNVEVEIGIENNVLRLSLCDNGKGFDPQTISGFGNGLMNMRKRIEVIGGVFTLDSRENKGTKAIISVPLQEDV